MSNEESIPDPIEVERLVAYDEARRQRGGNASETNEFHNDDSVKDDDQQVVDLLRNAWSAPAPEEPDGVPSTIGRFEIRRQVGHGGFGIVFEAFDPVIERPVALKVPHPELLISPRHRERFDREARAAGKLSHPNIIPVYDTGHFGPMRYIASAFCPGPSLARWIEHRNATSQGLVNPRDAAEAVEKIADALDHAHRQGVLHRDIKPANILLEPVEGDSSGDDFLERPLSSFEPRLTDLGLAKFTDGLEQGTRTGTLLGTPRYMAPEQIQGDSNQLGPATDVYGLGVVLYELLSGQAPFPGKTDVDTIRLVTTHEVKSLRAARPDIPRDLESICLRCLEKLPERRYESPEKLRDDLRRFLDGRPTLARPLTPWEHLVRWSRRQPALAGLVAVLLIATIVGIAGLATFAASQRRFNTQLSAALETADHARLRAEQSELQLQRRLYGADMKLAGQALAENDVRQVRSLLGRHVPRPGDRDIRDFVWHYLSTQISDRPLAEFQHASPVYKVSYSPDGKWVSTACADGHARLWDPNGPEHPVIDIDTAHGECNCASFDRTGTRLATTGDDRAIRIWEIETKTLLHTIKDAHEGMGYNVLFTNDGKHIVSCGADSRVRVWDVASGELVRDWENHQGGVTESIDLADDGSYVVSVGEDAHMVVRSLEQPSEESPIDQVRLDRKTEGIKLRAVQFFPGSVEAIAVNQIGTVFAYEPAADRLRGFSKVSHDQIRSVAISTKKMVIVGDDAGNVTRIRLDGDRAIPQGAPLAAHAGRVWSLAFHPKGDQFVTGADDGAVKVYPASFASVTAWRFPTRDRFQFDYLPDGDVVVASGEHSFEVLRLEKNTGDVKARRELGDEFNGLACRPDGKQFAATSQKQNAIWVFDADSLEPVTSFSANQPSSGVYSADGKQLAYIDRENLALVVVDSVSGAEIVSIAEVDAVGCVASPQGHAFASCHEGSIVLFDSVQRQQRRWRAQSTITSLAFTPDGKHLVSAGDRDLRLWDVASGRLIRTFEGHRNPLLTCDISRDGRTLVSGDMQEMKLWSIETGQEMLTVPGCTIFTRFLAGGRLLRRVPDHLILLDIAPLQRSMTGGDSVETIENERLAESGMHGASSDSTSTERHWVIGPGEFGVAGNWVEGAVPDAEDTLVLNELGAINRVINVTGGRTVLAVQVGPGHYTIAADEVNVGANTSSTSNRLTILDSVEIGPSEFTTTNLNIHSGGSVNLDGGSWTTTNLNIQSGGSFNFDDGTLTIDSGAWTGYTVGGAGVIRIRGNEATNGVATARFINGAKQEFVGSKLMVGQSTDGQLQIETGSVVDVVGELQIAAAGAESGLVIVDGVGSRLNVSDKLHVSHLGQAELNISGGATVTADRVVAGRGVGQVGHGEILIDGTGSQLTANRLSLGGTNNDTPADGSGDLTLSNAGHLQISEDTRVFDGSNLTINGGSVTTSDLTIDPGGRFNFDDGTLTIDGGTITGYWKPGASVAHLRGSLAKEGTATLRYVNSAAQTVDVDNFGVGHRADGILDIRSGSTFAATHELIIADKEGDESSVFVDGTGSRLDVGTVLHVGDRGNGMLLVTDGGLVTAERVLTARGSNGLGEIVISGDGSTLVANRLSLGGTARNVPSGGIGNLTLSSAGHLKIAKDTRVFDGSSLTINGGSVTTGDLTIDSGGTFNFHDGTLTIDGGTITSFPVDSHGTAFLRGQLGTGLAPSTTLNLENGATQSFGGLLVVGIQEDGFFNVRSGSTVQVGGDLSIAGWQRDNSAVRIDGNGSEIEVAGTTHVSNRGTATLEITNGAKFASDRLIAGRGVMGEREGNILVDGPGSRLIANRLSLGGDANDNPSGGTGVLTISRGGSVEVAQDLRVFAGTLSLADGSLTAKSMQMDSGTAFDFTGGTLNANLFTGDLTQKGGLITIGNTLEVMKIDGNYNQNAGRLAIQLIEGAQAPRLPHVQVSGVCRLSGVLHVEHADSSSLEPGASIVILTAEEGVDGEFDTSKTELPDLRHLKGEYQWQFKYSPTSVSIEVVPRDSNRST